MEIFNISSEDLLKLIIVVSLFLGIVFLILSKKESILRKKPYNVINIQLTLEEKQRLNRLIECSGTRDERELLGHTVGFFEKSINHELNGGSIKFVQENGVDSETVNLLGLVNKDYESWKDF